ncbi:putative quinol monooxygenase [Nocardia sp. alder85J]|uniref:putative quinol monooxygenase n=1 Tax=Nocardia sp. alder85J TaxID=2862949 RepID=UPI001CD2C954|nr:antibiotic biosynthesis monooxygenase family protein [Nocardia sp. alder85J]MCX4095457.1 antibiotic biosynthesis monooxygenase [Nocardia sp. alder85J]
MPDTPIVAIVQLRIRPGQVAAARETLAKSIPDTRAFPGCLNVTLLADNADEQRITLVEEWASLEHDRAYRKWRAGAGAVPGMADLFEGIPQFSQHTRIGE